MALFLIERNVGHMTQEQIEIASKRSNEVLAEMEGVTWVRSYVSDVDGKTFCEYEAPTAEHIREHARRAGVPADVIREIGITLSPAMFR